MENKIRFYEFSNSSISKSVPQLVYKIYDSLSKPIFYLVKDEAEVELYNKLFWTFSNDKFLPHGTVKDEADYYEKILISCAEENKNEAGILVSNSYPKSQDFLNSFEQKIYVFDVANNERFLKVFHGLKKREVPVEYFQQDASGKWHGN
jgi:DNA polymerase-3 subunit chi